LTPEEFFAKLKELNVRKSSKPIDMPVVIKTSSGIVRQELAAVTEVYLKSSYLKSFGFAKIQLPPEEEWAVVPQI
jgi:hypothetical protein